MAWEVLNFGKHAGRTLAQVALADPDWFFWAYESGVFGGKSEALRADAEKVYARCQRIRVPQTEGVERRAAEYLAHPATGKFVSLELVPESRSPLAGSGWAYRKTVIDLGFARSLHGADKTGCKAVLADAMVYLFGSRTAKLSRAQCDEFFDADENFDL